MARPSRLVLASAGVLLGLLSVAIAATQITLTYYLPGPSGLATSHTTAFGPAIIATAVAVVMAVVLIGWLVRNLIGPSQLWLWAIPVAALIISYAVTIGVSNLERPAF